jgi:RNA polymerase sigma factor (sigma-70 family)
MSYRSKFNPDYAKVYPNVDIQPEVLTAMRKSDRERRRIEYDLKNGKPIYVNNTTGKKTDKHDPDRIETDSEQGRETSLETYLALGEKSISNIVDEYANPLYLLIEKERYRELHHYLSQLAPEDQDLINALFFQEMTETEYARKIGKTQQAVNKAKIRILAKLKKYFLKKLNFWL